MKKLLLFIFVCFTVTSAAQDVFKKKIQFGVSSGILNVAKMEDGLRGEGIVDKSNFTGFYIGPMVQLSITKKLRVQGEILYGNANSEGYLIVPVQAKIGISPKLSLVLGPQANYSFEELSRDSFTNFALDGVGGLALNITRKFMVQARYAFQITDRSKLEQFSLKNYTFSLGIGYNF